ncbi:MAG: nitrous oxide reductase family maturation protein NosD [Candidatus Hodarchaeota archaeon]
MKKLKTKLIILTTVVMCLFSFTLFSIINNNLDNNDKYNKNLKSSKVSNPIYIDDNNPSHNWSVAKAAGKCTGEGTYSNPYIIEDLVIEGAGTDCIRIENSTVYFRIENCTVHSSNLGILLINVNNSQIIDNDCDSFSNYGIFLDNSHNNSITGNTVDDTWFGIQLSDSTINIVSGNIIGTQSWNGNGIWLSECNENVISGNFITECGVYGGTAINLVQSNNNTISGNTLNNNRHDGIKLAFSNDNTISGNTADGNDDTGIYFEYQSHNNTILDNTCNNNDAGIFLDLDCYENTISGNTVNYNDGGGIYLSKNGRNNVSGNTASYNTNDGINLDSSNDNTISGNTINNNGNDGIHLESSDDNIITGNGLNNNDLAIYLENSQRIEMSGNTIDQFALHLVGNLQMLASHDIDTTNLVGGKPIYYYANEVNLGSSDFTNAGQVILVNCNDSSISNLDVSYCPIGIALYYCNNNNVSGNTANDNTLYGILLHESSYNTISGNTLLRNGECIDEVGNCVGNVFSDNGECTYGVVSSDGIPGFSLNILIGTLLVAVIFISFNITKKWKIK